MMFTPKMTVAVRVLALLRQERGHLWMSERYLLNYHGIHRTTIEALHRRGVFDRTIDDIGERGCRFTPLALAVIEAVRA